LDGKTGNLKMGRKAFVEKDHVREKRGAMGSEKPALGEESKCGYLLREGSQDG